MTRDSLSAQADAVLTAGLRQREQRGYCWDKRSATANELWAECLHKWKTVATFKGYYSPTYES